MPRIYDANNNPLDYCYDCFITGKHGFDEDDNTIDFDADHPPYQDTEGYRCEVCGKLLTEEDN